MEKYSADAAAPLTPCNQGYLVNVSQPHVSGNDTLRLVRSSRCGSLRWLRGAPVTQHHGEHIWLYFRSSVSFLIELSVIAMNA